MPTRRIVLVLAVLLPALCAPGRGDDARADQASDRLIHLPGIAGARLLDRYFVAGIHDGGYAGESETYDWTAGDPGIAALLARRRNEREADKVAARIEKLLTDDPDLKIRLVCHSGGAGIAAWALERLPEGMQVETLVLVAPALSQRYDLSKALAHVRGKAYAFTSENDAIVLGAGTRLLGTIDGVKEDASGLKGFTKPEGADDAQYAKLVPMPYRAEWMDLGNIGDHVGPMGRTFAREVISLIVQGREPPPPRPTTRRSPREGEGDDEDAGAGDDAVENDEGVPAPEAEGDESDTPAAR
jgi:pimeloyl-ACP methyl ester carboxylesterase